MAVNTYVLFFFLMLMSFATADDRYVMNRLARSLGLQQPKDWSVGKNFCLWSSIGCDHQGRVTSIDLSNRNLRGLLPPELSQLSHLKMLDFQGNSFYGELPLLANISSLENISFDGNNFDSVPLGFGVGLNNLKSFTINNNPSLRPWAIPVQFRDSKILIIFSACNASLMGDIFPNIFARNLQNLLLSNNKLSGEISPTFTRLTSLRRLFLNNNLLSGSIPPSLATLPHLVTLDLSNNNLTGPIPVFPSNINVSWAGNLLLVNSGPSSKRESVGVIVGIVVAIIFVMCSIIFLLYEWKRRQTIEMRNSQGNIPHMSLQFIRRATTNFSSENILGRGGYGSIYRGELPNGVMVAVKRMELGGGTDQLNQFQAEIDVLTIARHAHLVDLYGYCITRREKLLVYEYMPQGNLNQHLFQHQQRGFPPLTWNQRMTIALNVARGIEYLHNFAGQNFIHRDIKFSNILLADDMTAKVADFGLTRSTIVGNSTVHTRLAGTFGYLAPEYGESGELSKAVDVYAFGVVLMELIMGKRVVDFSRPKEDHCIVQLFRRVFLILDNNGRVEVDNGRLIINTENIGGNIDRALQPMDEEMSNNISIVIELAGRCTAHHRRNRPSMSHAVTTLSTLLQEGNPSRYIDSFHIDSSDSSSNIDSSDSVSFLQVRLDTIEEETSMSSSID